MSPQARIARLRRECGCAHGTVAVAALLAVWPWAGPWGGWTRAAVFAPAALAVALVAKGSAVGISRMLARRLERRR